MKKYFLILFLFLATLHFAQVKNVISSDIQWRGYKTLKTLSLSHNGTIKLKSGNLIFNGEELTGGNFVFDMNSMDAEDLNSSPKLKKIFENHLKSDDFFDTAHFPLSTFQIKSAKKLNSTIYNYQITGILTIKGISKKISFPTKITESENTTSMRSRKFIFNRQLFGLKYNIFEDMLISNDIEMIISIAAK